MPYEDMPTVEDLSAPGALNTYINSRMRLYGFCGLPSGTIQYNSTLDLQNNVGGILTGTGQTDISFTSVDPNNGQGTFKATRLYFTGPANQPAVRLRNSSHMLFQNFAIERQTKGSAPGEGVIFKSESTGSPAGGPAACKIENVTFYNGNIGIEFGQNTSDHVNSDWVLDRPLFYTCNTGMRVNHDQGVNFLLNTPGFLNCGIGVHFVRGGNVMINNAGSNNGLGTLLRVDGAGTNAGMFIINHARLDSNDVNNPIPMVMNFSNCGGNYRAKASFINITGGYNNNPSHKYFREPLSPSSEQIMDTQYVMSILGESNSNYSPFKSSPVP
jgi:hypothetical protein